MSNSVNAQANMDVLRISHGVNFRFVKQVHLVSGSWIHTYFFELPSNLIDETHHTIFSDGSRKTHWVDNCLRHHDLSLGHGTHPLYRFTPSPESEERSGCLRFSSYIKTMLRMIKRNHELIKHHTQAIKDILPSTVNTSDISKRGLIDIGGKILSGLFGLATADDLNVISRQISKFVIALQKENVGVQKSVQDLSSFSEIAEKRLNLQASALRNISAQHEAAIYSLSHSVDDYIKFLVNIMSKYNKLSQSFFTFINYLDSFLDSLYTLAGGRLPSYLVTAKMLRETINDIHSATNKFKVIHNNPYYYYTKAKISYTVVNKHLVISVYFDLTLSENIFNVYRIHRLPLAVPGHYGAGMWLRDSETGIAIQQNREMFYFVSEAELSEIELFGRHSSLRRVVNKVKPEVCLLAIFSDNSQFVKKNCIYDIILNSLQSRIDWLGGDKFLFTHVSEYWATCADTRSVQRQTCENICFAKAAGSCSVDSANSSILLSFEESGNSKVTHSYPINKALLSHFFNESELQMIMGDTLFNSEVELQLPTIKFFKPDASSYFAEDDRIKYTLHKSVEAIKADKEIISGAADAISKGIQSLPSDFTWLDCTTILFMIVSTLVVIQSIYLSIRLRTLAAVIATFQTQLREAQAQVVNMSNPVFIYSVSTPQSAAKELNVIIVDKLSNNWIWILFGLVLLILLIVLVKWQCDKCLKQVSHNRCKTELILQLSAGAKNVLVPIHTVYALPNDVAIAAVDGLPSEFTISGCLVYKLRFTWKANVTNCFTEQRSAVKNFVRLSIAEKFLVSGILRQRFFVSLILRCGSEIIKPVIHPLVRSRAVSFNHLALRTAVVDDDFGHV